MIKLGLVSKEKIDPSFVSRIESIISDYEAKKSENYIKKAELSNSLTKKYEKEVDELWRQKVESFSEYFEVQKSDIKDILDNTTPKSHLPGPQREYIAKILKAWAIYEIKNKNKFQDSFNNTFSEYYALINDVERFNKNRQQIECLKEVKVQEARYVDIAINSLISQLGTMHKDYKVLKNKDASLDDELFNELSGFCGEKSRYIDEFTAKVTKCFIKKEGGNEIIRRLHHNTVLSIDHPIIKILTITDSSLLLPEGTEITFDVNLTEKLNTLVPKISEINKKEHPNFVSKSTFYTSRFDKLKIKRNLCEAESVNSKVIIPGEITYEA